jgi:GTP-binding protein Era
VDGGQPEAALRAGFVAIVGPPNAGKSTLLNRLLGEKIAIVTPRPQTTRSRILGVWNGPGAQIAFFDTPGLHRSEGALNRRMVHVALQTLGEVDAALLILSVEAAARPGGPEPDDQVRWAVERVARAGRPVLLGLNQIDRVARDRLLPLIESLRALHDFAAIVPISARTGENVEELLRALTGLLPAAPAPLFPPDVLTDQAERQIAAEYVREQLMILTRDEVPYACAVEVEEFDEAERGRGEHGLVRIGARISVEREGQKGIVMGKGGELLKRVGTGARKGLERLFGCKVFLALRVVVDPGWSERPDAIRRHGP